MLEARLTRRATVNYYVKFSRRVTVLLALIALVASISAIVYASFVQTFPAVTVAPVVFATHANCTTVHIQGTPPSPNGTVIGNCLSGTAPVAAFNVNRDGTSTPTFTITNGVGILGSKLGIDSDGSGCGGTITPLTSGSAVTFAAAGGWIYCLSYNSTVTGGTINSFSVSWTP